MWSSTVGLINGKHRYLTAESFGFKINSNGQALKKRQQWTIEPFPDIMGPDGSISSAASVSSQYGPTTPSNQSTISSSNHQHIQDITDTNNGCILTFNSGMIGSSLNSLRSSLNGSSSSSDQDGCEEHENVALKSHMNKYLAVDSFGNVTCDSDEKTENGRFTITICSMSQGRSKDEMIFWAIKNVERGYYLGTTEDGQICCNAKMPKSRAELWHLHLIPARGASFFALKSLGRKRFARVAALGDDADAPSAQAIKDKGDSQVQLDGTISWGPETLFQFRYFEGGRYSILTSDSNYLTNEGRCILWKEPHENQDGDGNITALPPSECLFTLEYHSGFLAFRDFFGHYLAAAGRSSVLRSRSVGVSRDELFVFECAPIQVAMKAAFNNRWVSVKQGVDLTANQTDITDRYETFQMTFHKQTQNWSIMTQECNFWTVSPSTSTISVCKPADYDGLARGQFKLAWSDTDATFSIKFIDYTNKQERWIAARKSGQLYLANGNTSPLRLIMQFQNRKLLNLRPVDASGFVGIKAGSNSCQLEATKTSPDSIAVEYSVLGGYNQSNSNNNGPIRDVIDDQPEESYKDRTVNIFNVRLNSTKPRSDHVDQRLNSNSKMEAEPIKRDDDILTSRDLDKSSLIEEEDSNNNNNDCYTQDRYDEVEKRVESTPIASVASIISSFSNARVTSNNQRVVQPQRQTTQFGNGMTSVMRLANNFSNNQLSNNNNTHSTEANSDTASVITSCSSVSSNSQLASSCLSGAVSEIDKINPKISSCFPTASGDQSIQLECCYLKNTTTNRYLNIKPDDSSIICDATNRACAQAWILELRSQNSVAIRASDNHAYMQLGQNGVILLSKCEPNKASLWEF